MTTVPSTGFAVTIEFEGRLDPDRVAGTVLANGREPRRFSGWMALLEVLEALTTEDDR